MNTKRFIVSVVALFIFIFIYESLVHGFLLTGLYSETPTIWRDYSQLKAYTPFNTIIMGLLSIWITFIFTRIFKSGGWKSGLQFGFYLGVLSGIQAAGAFYYLPISFALAMAWFVSNLVEVVLGGLLIGILYHK